MRAHPLRGLLAALAMLAALTAFAGQGPALAQAASPTAPAGQSGQVNPATAAQPAAPGSPADTDDGKAAVVDDLKGQVSAFGPDGSTRPLAVGDTLRNGEGVSTGPGASCQVRLADGTLVSLGASSSLTVADAAYDPDRPDAASAVCRLGRGVYRCLTGEAAAVAPERFRLETPLAVIGVRGTELGVTVGEKTVEAGVFSGGPGFVTAVEGGSPVRLRAGQSVAKGQGVPFGRIAAIPARLRGLVEAVPMRLGRDLPFSPPGRIKDRPAPPFRQRAQVPGRKDGEAPGKGGNGKDDSAPGRKVGKEKDAPGRGGKGRGVQGEEPGKGRGSQQGDGPGRGGDGQSRGKGRGGEKNFLERAGEAVSKSARSAGDTVRDAFQGKGGKGRGDDGRGKRDDSGQGKRFERGGSGRKPAPEGNFQRPDNDRGGRDQPSGRGGRRPDDGPGKGGGGGRF